MNSKTRETGATQDMYRRTLAASWQLVPGELNADECIEDIFGGGDGWTSGSGRKAGKSVIFDPGRREASDSDSLSQLSAGASTPTTTTSTTNEKPMASLLAVEPIKYGSVKKKGYALSIMTGRSKFAAHAGVKAQPKEIDEYEARDDLMSWRMPGIRLTKR